MTSDRIAKEDYVVIAIAAAGSDYDAAGSAAAAEAASQPVDSDLTAIAALTTTSYGRALLALADAAAGRTAFGLGTASTHPSTDFDAAGAAAGVTTTSIGAQPVDSDLTAIAALTTTSFGRGLLTAANAAALGIVKGDVGLGSVDNTADTAKTVAGDVTGTLGASVLAGTTNVENIIRANSLDQLTPPAANLSLNSKKITNLANASLTTDALPKGQADGLYQPIDPDLTALAQGAGWLLDSNTWTVHVVPTQASMTTIVAASTVGHSGLTYVDGDAVIASGFSNTTGVTNGALYYIKNPTGSGASTVVQLALTPGGTAVTFGGTADTTAVTLTGVNQFTVPVDATGYLGPGTKISYNDGAVDYGVITTAKNNSGTTTVTLIPNNDYAIANATLTAPRFSYFESPVGFPASFAFTPILTGFATAGPTLGRYWWRTVARTLYLEIAHLNTAVSNSATHTISLPTMSAAANTFVWNAMLITTDSGTAQAGNGTIANGVQSATINGKITGGNTASGNSSSSGILVYEF